MREDIKDLLKRYDEIGALILEQKLDEFGDKLDQKPEGVDDATYEEYIQRLAKEETELATEKLENEPDEKLGDKSMRQIIDELDFEEKIEALEFCALNLDRGVPASLISSISGESADMVREYCGKIIGECAWTEEELSDDNVLFEMQFQKAIACFKVLIQMKEPCFIQAVLDRYMSYGQTREFVAESIAEYIEAFPEVSEPFLINMIESNFDNGLEGPCEDCIIMLTEIGKEHKTEEIYQTLRHAFRYMTNKIYAVICLADYGDDRAVQMFKNYINRNQKTIERDLFYEMMSAIQNLGGDISDIQDPFGDFQKKQGKG
ncbi:MAG: RNA-directed RNA polymerase catalytic subunit [Saccharofermentans sp.]|nr:RNA-directed RNA polymerase catalytic subunit [Saccharofermentans sp.]